MEKGYLLLQSGDVFEGTLLGAQQEAVGEVVFHTGMTGYQETITDPSYAGQILTFCYPFLGNVGWNSVDAESEHIHLSGIITGEVCMNPSHYAQEQTIDAYLRQQGVPCLADVDTRALVKVIRQYRTLKGCVISRTQVRNPQLQASSPTFWEKRSLPSPAAEYWIDQVSTPTVHHYGPGFDDPEKESNGNVALQKQSEPRGIEEALSDIGGDRDTEALPGTHIVLIDYGYKKSIADHLLQLGCTLTVVPYHTSFGDIQTYKPDGVVLSNGPGDPLAMRHYFTHIRKVSETYPTLGIGLGHQLLAHVYGAQTEKLKYGHRGANHPVQHVHTGRVLMTPQNHGYVVVEDSLQDTPLSVLYRHVNDRTLEGLQHETLPILSVQFHPESHAGPDDTAFVFQQFAQRVNEHRQVIQHQTTGDMPYALTK